ncbi:pseudouridine synthase [Variovorax dokdonensis]|uniref:Pseudouridine synthase n=1 Tax=Variovorax dokdonensis TaxID=344883 RepID=A0ABT7N8G8_9BURK|nr:pseudouridine synthase [Variovorax dokdonensis]MDM0044231.1 pseudouridine synthase [Variovorax dokdonensis]
MRKTDAAGNPLPPKPRRRVRAVSPLPMRDGVSASWVMLPDGPWSTLLDFFEERFPLVTRQQWHDRMRAGLVADAQGRPVEPEAPYRAHQRLWYWRELDDEADIPFEETVLYRDERILVADKPHFMPVVPTGRYLQSSLLVRLKRRLGIETLSPLHRIDRGTAGIVLFSVDSALREPYQALFRDRAAHKQYEAIVHWRPGLELPAVHRSHLRDDESFLRTCEQSGAPPNSESRIELLRANGRFAHLKLEPVSGRKHQLRVHCAALGAPIVNDDYYPKLLPEGPDDFSRPLQLLARALSFVDPLDGRERHFESQRRLGMESQVHATDS